MTRRRQTRHLAVLACGFIASIVVFSEALGPYLTWEGEPLSARFLTIFLLPITATAIYQLITSLRSPRPGAPANPAADPAIDGIVFCVLTFLMGMHFLLLAVLMRVEAVEPWAGRSVVVMVGLTLAAVGNLLPRTRPNVALGIRTSRTLADRQLWMLTHRAGGYIAVAVGAVTVASGMFLTGTRVAALPGIAFLAGGVLLAVCYRKLARVSSSAHHT